MSLEDLLWRLEAPCLGLDQKWWYPPLGLHDPKPYYETGRQLCRVCPVWQDCLVVGEGEKFGMWGGLTPKERDGRRTWPHGVWMRYRQGCRCHDCAKAHAELGAVQQMVS